jgi:hypothetical protein
MSTCSTNSATFSETGSTVCAATTAAIFLAGFLTLAGCDGPSSPAAVGPAPPGKGAIKRTVTWRGLDTGYEGETVVEADGTQVQQ